MVGVRRVELLAGGALLALAGLSVASAQTAGCGPNSTCGLVFRKDTTVTLTASPNEGAVFKRWLGACSGYQPSCVVTMDQAKNVAAQFETPPSFTSTIPQLAEAKQDFYALLMAIRKWAYDNGVTFNYSALSLNALTPYTSAAERTNPWGSPYQVNNGAPLGGPAPVDGFRLYVWGIPAGAQAQWISEMQALFTPYGLSQVFPGWGNPTDISLIFNAMNAGYSTQSSCGGQPCR